MKVNQILQGDVLDRLKDIPDGIVQTVVTSPPYWGLRDYSVDGQLGLEKTPEEYIEKMVAIFREVRRVMRDDGTLWLNMGDSYAHSGTCGGSSPDGDREYRKTDKEKQEKMKYQIPPGLKPKDLCGIPWRLALALQADGWWLRSDIIWSKPNPMPESCTDRPSKAHEYLFLLTKKANYYYDADAIREPQVEPNRINTNPGTRSDVGEIGLGNTVGGKTSGYNPAGRNARSVWTIATQPFDGEYCTNCDSYYTGSSKNRIAIIKIIEDGEEKTKRVCPSCQSTENWIEHFATFPEELARRCILAGSAEQACGVCGAPWERVIETSYRNDTTTDGRPARGNSIKNTKDSGSNYMASGVRTRRIDKTLGFRPTCEHKSQIGYIYPPDGSGRCIILDPFMGAGTVALVALKGKRNFLGIELSENYIKMAMKRIEPHLKQEILI